MFLGGDGDYDKEPGDLGECQSECGSEKKEEINSCVIDCVPRCEGGEDIWDYFEEEDEHPEEKGVFRVGGICREVEGEKRSNRDSGAFIFFDGWGVPFDLIHEIKNRYYSVEGDWCKDDLENLIKQRIEFEKGFNEEFAEWFFGNYLANSAEDWEGHLSGIYEIYWNNVDNQMQTAERMKCLGKKDITEFFQPNIISFETEEMKYWEELKEVNIRGIGKVKVISPYMELRFFPPDKFIENEMKKSNEEW